MKALLLLLSLPFIALSRLAEALNLWNVRSDLACCLKTVDNRADEHAIPNSFLEALVIAEDRRNADHFGVDPIGMMRAAASLVTRNGLQGASTIEQQFVRVVTKRYERTISRKIREQALAISLARRRTKTQISAKYLHVAFYGHGLVGAQGLYKLCGNSLQSSSSMKIYGIIARLKYPEPLNPSPQWKQKISLRAAYIAALHSEASSQSLSGHLWPSLPAKPPVSRTLTLPIRRLRTGTKPRVFSINPRRFGATMKQPRRQAA